MPPIYHVTHAFNLRVMTIVRLLHRCHDCHCHYFIEWLMILILWMASKFIAGDARKSWLRMQPTQVVNLSSSIFYSGVLYKTEMQCTQPSPVMHYNPCVLHSIYWCSIHPMPPRYLLYDTLQPPTSQYRCSDKMHFAELQPYSSVYSTALQLP